MSTEIPADVLAHLVARDQERARQVESALAKLTFRERRLVKEAAVMGYVRGTLAPRGEQVPADSLILREVVAACQAMPDLYPTITGHKDAR